MNISRACGLKPKTPLLAKNARNGAPSLFEEMRREWEMWAVSLAKKPGIGRWPKDLTAEAVKFFPVYSCLIVYGPRRSPFMRSPFSEADGTWNEF
jgi:hypothetical protein